MGATQSIDLELNARGKKAKRTQSDSFGRARINWRTQPAVTVFERTVADMVGDSAMPRETATRNQRSVVMARNWPFNRATRAADQRSYSMHAVGDSDYDNCNGIVLNHILRNRQSQKRCKNEQQNSDYNNDELRQEKSLATVGNRSEMDDNISNKQCARYTVEGQLNLSSLIKQQKLPTHQENQRDDLAEVQAQSQVQVKTQAHEQTQSKKRKFRLRESKVQAEDQDQAQDQVQGLGLKAESISIETVNERNTIRNMEEIDGQKLAEDQLIDGELTLKLLRKIPQCAPPKPPRSPIPTQRRMPPDTMKANSSGTIAAESPLADTPPPIASWNAGSLSDSARGFETESIGTSTEAWNIDDIKCMKPPRKPSRSMPIIMDPALIMHESAIAAAQPVNSRKFNARNAIADDVENASRNEAQRIESSADSNLTKNEMSRQQPPSHSNLSLPSESLGYIFSAEASAAGAIARRRPTDLSISPREQRILRIPTSPTSLRYANERVDDVRNGISSNTQAATITDANMMVDDTKIVHRKTSMPSIIAAAVVGSWRKTNSPSSNGTSDALDELTKLKRISLGSRKSEAQNGAWYEEDQPLTPLGPGTASESDDSLATKEDSSLKDYHLSNLSNEVLMQIIRRFPFNNATKTKTDLIRTTSNETEVLTAGHDSAENVDSGSETPRTPSTTGGIFAPLMRARRVAAAPSSTTPSTPDSVTGDVPNGTNGSNGSPWNLKKRFLSRHYQNAVTDSAESVDPLNSKEEGVIKRKSSSSLKLKMPKSKPSKKPLVRSESNSNFAEHTNKGALGKLCKVSVDTMAITALPLDCWLKERLKNWVQLSGHAGTIVPASNHTLWKKLPQQNTTEAKAYARITADSALTGLTPKFYKEIVHKNESFIEIQDLLAQFPDTASRAIMDIKIGVRTFMESEVSNTTKRADLYKKMVDIAPEEPTEEEHADRAITKLRYMQFRERESSTALLGFRIEAAQLPGGKLQKNFKRVQTKQQVLETLVYFFGESHAEICTQLAQRLRQIRDGIQKSEFFRTHEVVGSSILIIYDKTKTGAWMIDFAKSTTVPEPMILNHRVPWVLGNHEDGYLIGLENLIEILEMDEKQSRRTLPASVLTTVNK